MNEPKINFIKINLSLTGQLVLKQKKSIVTNLCIFTDYVASQIIDHCQIDMIYTDIPKAFVKVSVKI